MYYPFGVGYQPNHFIVDLEVACLSSVLSHVPCTGELCSTHNLGQVICNSSLLRLTCSVQLAPMSLTASNAKWTQDRPTIREIADDLRKAARISGQAKQPSAKTEQHQRYHLT